MGVGVLARLFGGVLLLLISIVAWRSSDDPRITILLLVAAWIAYLVAVARFLLAERQRRKSLD